ncbi:CdaR family protein [Marispirochaeta sp.]|uniref:CdaR family protein n=1 Tax=Marispirochaeta sp. TaxID=2038653 RepID=UPI0029C76BA9|nr:CdaR family protein [Marispirochaeta sp.]
MNIRQLLERTAHNWPVKVLSLTLAVLLFLFYRISSLEERFFSAPLEVRINENFVPADPYPRNARVTIRGDRDAVFNIIEDDIQVFADFSDFKREGIFKAPLQYHKQGSALSVDYLEITVEPVEVKLELEEKSEKVVEVVPNIVGYPARGYELGQYFVSPEKLRIEGPRSSVQDIRSIMTEPIDLTNLRSSITLKVGFETEPEDMIRFPDYKEVEFRGIIQETRLIRTFEGIDLLLLDLDEGFTIKSDIPAGSIKFQGTQLVLEAVSPEDFALVIDGSLIRSPGVYRLPVEAEVPGEILILNYEPEEITLTVEEAEGL